MLRLYGRRLGSWNSWLAYVLTFESQSRLLDQRHFLPLQIICIDQSYSGVWMAASTSARIEPKVGRCAIEGGWRHLQTVLCTDVLICGCTTCCEGCKSWEEDWKWRGLSVSRGWYRLFLVSVSCCPVCSTLPLSFEVKARSCGENLDGFLGEFSGTYVAVSAGHAWSTIWTGFRILRSVGTPWIRILALPWSAAGS